jgi:hypothetical protein
MLNRHLALTLALIGGILTLLAGLLQDVRPLTIGYRSFVSCLVFGVCGYLLGSMIDSYQQREKENIKPPGQLIDIISKDENIDIGQPAVTEPADNGFRAFTPDTFEQVPGK